jgi:hypothetical protein
MPPSSLLITIPYVDDDDSRFNCVGRFEGDKQFMAFVTGAYPSDLETGRQFFPGLGPAPGTGPKDQHWYGVIHTFDRDGNHLKTVAHFGGTTADGRDASGDRAFELVNVSLAELGELEFCSIRVRPFRVVIDERVFGLVHGRNEESEWVMLWPNDVMFHPPWDGKFST